MSEWIDCPKCGTWRGYARVERFVAGHMINAGRWCVYCDHSEPTEQAIALGIEPNPNKSDVGVVERK